MCLVYRLVLYYDASIRQYILLHLKNTKKLSKLEALTTINESPLILTSNLVILDVNVIISIANECKIS